MSTLSNTLPEEQSKEPTKKHPPLWRNRDYLLLIGGQGVSSLGSQVSLIAAPLLMFSLTGSPALAGLLGTIGSLPTALLLLPAGALADRWDRKKMMILCDAGRALAVGSIPLAMLLGNLTYLQLFLVALIEGILAVFFTSAETVSLPQVVPSEQLPTAVGQDQVLYSATSMIGPTLGPILYGLGRMVPFLSDAVSYTASVISLLFIKIPFQKERRAEQAAPQHLWQDIKEGIFWLWRYPVLRFLALLTFGLITPCYGYVLIIIVIGQQLHADPVTMGLIFGSGGVGSVIGALIAAPLYRRFGFAKTLIVSAWIWAISWLFYGFAPNTLLLGIINAVSFTIVPVYTVVSYSFRLSVIPDHLQGRVNSVFRLLAFGGQPLGIALTGLLLQAVGPMWTVVLLFIPQGIMCVAATFNKEVHNTTQVATH